MKTWNYHGEQIPRRDVIRYRGLAVAADLCLAGYVVWLVGMCSFRPLAWIGCGMMTISVGILVITQ